MRCIISKLEPLGQWRHIEAVLKARQQMGGDVCEMWVAIAQASEIWHPRRCESLCQEASKASEEVPALLCAGGTFSEVEQVVTSTVEADNLIAEGVALAMPEEIEKFQSSSVLMRLPILCKFLATLPPTMLNHEFCDLAFCSYAWNDPKTQRCLANDADLSWSVFCSGAKDGASRLAAVLGAQTVSASTEEKQAAFVLRRSAGAWAVESINAADFVRFMMAANTAAEAIALAQLFAAVATDVDVDRWWRAVGETFLWNGEAQRDGVLWLQQHGPEFVQQARVRLGALQEPSEKLDTLLRSNKPFAFPESKPCNEPMVG
eukprot:g1069.t1